MSKAAAKTGAGPMFAVAVGQFFPVKQRLIQDDLAASLIPPPVRYLLPLMRLPFMRKRVVRELEASSPSRHMHVAEAVLQYLSPQHVSSRGQMSS